MSDSPVADLVVSQQAEIAECRSRIESLTLARDQITEAHSSMCMKFLKARFESESLQAAVHADRPRWVALVQENEALKERVEFLMYERDCKGDKQ